ncbi:hypothetical protein B0H17DRAFT_1058503 [Mycena rosella]|uniref:F-box domain-containing protein n=1 Tax=Mycena rosella TaxID=1033263 RepID=A0AAD7DL56_MYCRO|nr:hypothetical protein B0H17DRAFT_1058503 [Mycena rosella]
MFNADLRAQAQDLISAISCQQQILDSLKAQLEDVQRQLHSIVYPVLTLPPEITSEIFVHCLSPSRRLAIVDAKEAPLLLMHVCSAWRGVAVSSPVLWATLDINATSVAPHFSEIFAVWLQRAGQCQLSVKIGSSLLEIGDSDFDGFWGTFRRHSGEMRSLELNLTRPDFERMNTHLLAFPLLQNLGIHFAEHDTSLKMFDHVPMLHELCMNYAPPTILLPWQRLTKFTAKWYTLTECLEALRLMPNIVECHFSSLIEEDSPPASISHPKMQSFTLFDSATDILDFLTLPALHTLEILDPTIFDEDTFDIFLSRSAPLLQSLVMKGDANLRFASLMAVTTLTKLEIWNPPILGIGALFGFFENDTFLPRLRTLSFLGCEEHAQKASVFDLVEMAPQIADIRGTRPDFQSFRLTADAQRYLAAFSEEQLLLFRKLETEGMHVYIGMENESIVHMTPKPD